MSEIQFMRWLTSVGIFDQSVAYRNTFDPIRGFWGYEDTCVNRVITIFDTSFNDVYTLLVDKHFSERVEEYQKEISKIFEL